MCHYTDWGIFVFTFLPSLFCLALVILLSIKIFKVKKLHIAWKIILFILLLFLTYVLYVVLSNLYFTGLGKTLFGNQDVLKCAGLGIQ